MQFQENLHVDIYVMYVVDIKVGVLKLGLIVGEDSDASSFLLFYHNLVYGLSLQQQCM